MKNVSEIECGDGSVQRSGGEVKDLIERCKSVEIVEHGGDFGGVGFVFDLEKDDVFDD